MFASLYQPLCDYLERKDLSDKKHFDLTKLMFIVAKSLLKKNDGVERAIIFALVLASKKTAYLKKLNLFKANFKKRKRYQARLEKFSFVKI